MKLHVIVLAAVLPVASAGAGVRIDVDPTAPFTEYDLAQAINLRLGEQPREDVDIRVGRLGFEQLLVVVGDKTQTVALADRDRAESARIVALIITSMVSTNAGPPGDAAPLAAHDTSPAPASRAVARSRWSLIAGASFDHHKSGTLYDPEFRYGGTAESFDLKSLRGGVAMAIRPDLRAIATASVGELSFDAGDGFRRRKERAVPVRVGLEASSGLLGVEIGAQRFWYTKDQCNGGWNHSTSLYGAVKMFVPIGDSRVRGVIDLGGHYVVKEPDYNPGSPCIPLGTEVKYGGWAGAGLEVAL